MLSTKSFSILLLWLTYVIGAESRASSCDPSPAFPPPTYNDAEELQDAFRTIKTSISDVLEDAKFNSSSFSIEVTSSQTTVWSLHHTAKEKNETRPGTSVVNGDSVYRIASITKTFTVLGILQQDAAGNLSLDDTIDKYLPELQKKQEGSIPWKDITLRSLASQLSGIPRELAQSDFLTEFPDPTAWGLPPVSAKDLPHCDSYTNYEIPCKREDLIRTVQARLPVFPPNQKSTYSNLAFDLLGLVIANVTGLSYEEYVTSSILQALGMNNSSFTKPPDSNAVIPKGPNYWDVDEGIQNPTGGLFSSSADLSKYLRYILTHYNGITPTLNWLNPLSWSTGLHTSFGMPWEIFRTDKILHATTNRPVTFVTKSGNVPGYSSIIILLPEYDLGITILVSSPMAPLSPRSGDLFSQLRELLSTTIVLAAESVAHKSVARRYVGHYNTFSHSPSPNNNNNTTATTSPLNSSLTLLHTPTRGLHIQSFISNSTDFLTTWRPLIDQLGGGRHQWRLQLVPTLLYRDQARLAGELWRIVVVPEEADGRERGRGRGAAGGVWDDFQITDHDGSMYAGKPLNELVFWMGEDGDGEEGKMAVVEEVEFTGFRVRMSRVTRSSIRGGEGSGIADGLAGDADSLKWKEQRPLGG